MLEWISANNQVISALANVCMLLVWVAYLHIFISNYRRQKRPKILVNRGAGSGIDARCLISNMSAEPIYIQSFIATVETAGGHWTCPVTEWRETDRTVGRSDLKLATRQGPLLGGHFIDIGSFRSLIDRVLESSAGRHGGIGSDDPGELVAFEIKVIAVHGSEDLLAGAIRRFDMVRREDGLHLRGHGASTEQIRSRSKRRRLHDELEADL